MMRKGLLEEVVGGVIFLGGSIYMMMVTNVLQGSLAIQVAMLGLLFMILGELRNIEGKVSRND